VSTVPTLNTFFYGGVDAPHWTGVASDGTGAVAVSAEGSVAVWAAITDWSLGFVTRTGLIQSFSAVAYGGGKYVAVSSGSSKCAYSSDGGWTWSEGTMPRSADWAKVGYGSVNGTSYFIAIARGSGTFAYSTDGVTWYSANMPSSQDWNQLVYGGTSTKFVALANNTSVAAYIPTTAVLTPGSSPWTTIALPGAANWSDIRWNATAGAMRAVGYYYGYYLTSADGITWTQTALSAASRGGGCGTT